MRLFTILAATTLLAGCSAAQDPGQSTPVQEALDTQQVVPDTAKGPATSKLPVALPQLAYSYAVGFLLPGDKIAAAQDAHRNQCDAMGPARCQLLSLERDGSESNTGATLKLRVVTSEAKAFADAASQIVSRAGGRATETKVGTDDVSKAIVDTEARIRQRELLVARLTEVLRTRSGKVSELVEAERSVAASQEELDQARGWLRELRGRVAMSDIAIRYTAIAPSADADTIGTQLGEAGQGSAATFMLALRTMLTLAIYLLPWGLVILPTLLLLRRRKQQAQG
ncbi:DUF4349 domain-containing protein [Sphingomonas sp. MMS12-HWE2-04]|uniref:DUF4349 domain-containing protein n=1 Tax=Sphingomonas sp. MMS12-HWE2-04 TaxID=3234199 RepID=UPI00384BAC55